MIMGNHIVVRALHSSVYLWTNTSVLLNIDITTYLHTGIIEASKLSKYM